MSRRLTIITNGNYYSRVILEGLVEKYHADITSIVIIDGDYRGRVGVKAGVELLKSMALEYFLYKIGVIVFLKVAKIIYKKIVSVEDFVSNFSIPIIHFNSIKQKEAIEHIVSEQADLIVSVSCPQMIGKKILESAKLGGINIHSSLLPKYAGLAPYFWVLKNGEQFTGSTVHYMTLKFDEGNILAQQSVKILNDETVCHLFGRLAFLGNRLLLEGIEKALCGDPGRKQDFAQYSYFSNPDRPAIRSLNKNGHSLININDIRKLIG